MKRVLSLFVVLAASLFMFADSAFALITKSIVAPQELHQYTKRDYSVSMKKKGYTVLYFYKLDSKYENMQTEAVKKAAYDYPEVRFFKIDMESQKSARKKFKVKKPGTILILKKGRTKHKLVNIKDADKIESKFEKYLK